MKFRKSINPVNRLIKYNPTSTTATNEKIIFATNRIRTTKYTLYNFVFKNLFEQFSKVANFYFLFIILIQVIDYIEVSSLFYSSFPLVFVITVTAIKDVYEDIKRYLIDKQVNQSTTLSLESQELPFKANVEAYRWKMKQWQDLKVGDVIMLKENDNIPADLLILAASSEVVYVETKNLDGETNLKPKYSINIPIDQLLNTTFTFESEPPNTHLHSFNATVTTPTLSKSVTINEMLLRGCCVRNTEWVIGFVVFTGKDSKIIMNSGDTPSKKSRIERLMQIQVILNFCILAVMCISCTIALYFYSLTVSESVLYFINYFIPLYSNQLLALLTFFTCLVMLQNLVPISLYISIEFCKTAQAFFIFKDIDMYHAPSDTACVAKRWNISDDLGQIEYIFSDKTGTLTRNVMEFKKCTVGENVYGDEYETEADMGARLRNQSNSVVQVESVVDGQKVAQMSKLLDAKWKNPYAFRLESQPEILKLTFADLDLVKDMVSTPELYFRSENVSHSNRVYDFFMLLAVCHTVLVSEKNGKLEYKAQSPDEEALVSAARELGFVFTERSPTTDVVRVIVHGREIRFTMLHELEFNSTRKRMSVIVRDEVGRILLLTKGADSIIYQRLATSKLDEDRVKKKTTDTLEHFATEGLRTLCSAFRELSAKEYDVWSKAYKEASESIDERDEKMDLEAEKIERELTLIGATAIEDKLQEGVPDCIATLAKAGIKIWVLTGDKMETAINIGFSCNLLTLEMLLVVVNGSTGEGVLSQLEEAIKGLEERRQVPRALVIDGESLKFALDTTVAATFLQMATQCKAVICCRVSPLQKALVVKLVRESLNILALAIGDGANDVSMIQEADVGVGISGQEGLQAAMSADYAIAQFRFLTKLLLVHGRWSYLRVAEMVFNFFFKNVVWTFTTFWFQIFCSFSANVFYDFTFIMFYNLIFTVAPVIAMGSFDQDVTAENSLQFPQLYGVGIRQELFTLKRFWIYISDGIYQSLVCFYFPFAFLRTTTLGSDGWSTDLAELSVIVATCSVLCVNLTVALNTQTWNWITTLFTAFSAFILFLYAPVWSYFPDSNIFGIAGVLYPRIAFYTIIPVTVILALLPRYMLKFINQTYRPSDTMLCREISKYGESRICQGNTRKSSLGRRGTASMVDMKSGIRTSVTGFAFSGGEVGLRRLSLENVGEIKVEDILGCEGERK